MRPRRPDFSLTILFLDLGNSGGKTNLGPSGAGPFSGGLVVNGGPQFHKVARPRAQAPPIIPKCLGYRSTGWGDLRDRSRFDRVLLGIHSPVNQDSECG